MAANASQAGGDISAPQQPQTQDIQAQNTGPPDPPRPAKWEPLDLTYTAGWNAEDLQQAYSEEINDRLKKVIASRQDKEENNNLSNFLKLKVIKSLKRATRRDSIKYDQEWTAHRYLGSGSFGCVALWVRKNEEGEITDEMAIKQADYNPNVAWSQEPPLSKEAVIQNHLNTSKVENFVYLRDFKAINCLLTTKLNGHPLTVDSDASPPPEGRELLKWRYYLEFAPYGDISRLMDRYRAWNRYLPEKFLWHVFDSLARAVCCLTNHPINMQSLPKGDSSPLAHERVVHLDIKPENIFLGYEKPVNNSEKSLYGGIAKLDNEVQCFPMIKLGDFGIAEFTAYPDERLRNPMSFWKAGTAFYKAPEMTHYGADWPQPPNGSPVSRPTQFKEIDGGDWRTTKDKRPLEEIQATLTDPGFGLEQPMNVWGIGKVMFDLITLAKPSDYAAMSTRDFKQYQRNDQHALPDFTETPFLFLNRRRREVDPVTERRTNSSPYSNGLMKLVAHCMRPSIEARIRPAELFEQTTAGLKNATTKVAAALPAEKVYYKSNEINEMKVGDEDFFRESDDVGDLLDADSLDPDWQPLNLPAEVWNHYMRKWEKPRDQTAGTFQPQDQERKGEPVVLPRDPNVFPVEAPHSLGTNRVATQPSNPPPEDEPQGKTLAVSREVLTAQPGGGSRMQPQEVQHEDEAPAQLGASAKKETKTEVRPVRQQPKRAVKKEREVAPPKPQRPKRTAAEPATGGEGGAKRRKAK